jgi:hypothetical protein
MFSNLCIRGGLSIRAAGLQPSNKFRDKLNYISKKKFFRSPNENFCSDIILIFPKISRARGGGEWCMAAALMDELTLICVFNKFKVEVWSPKKFQL